MEYCKARAAQESEILCEKRKQQQRSGSFNDHRSPQEEAGKADNAADLRCADGVLHRHALKDADPFAGSDHQQHRHRHDPESADLDQQQDDDPAKQRPL